MLEDRMLLEGPQSANGNFADIFENSTPVFFDAAEIKLPRFFSKHLPKILPRYKSRAKKYLQHRTQTYSSCIIITEDNVVTGSLESLLHFCLSHDLTPTKRRLADKAGVRVPCLKLPKCFKATSFAAKMMIVDSIFLWALCESKSGQTLLNALWKQKSMKSIIKKQYRFGVTKVDDLAKSIGVSKSTLETAYKKFEKKQGGQK